MPISSCVMGLVVKSITEQIRIGPRIAEIVFRSGTKDGRHFFVIDEELFVTFPPPATLWLSDVQRGANVAATAAGLEQSPVDRPRRI